eukprot:TRINITY_DN4226_c0_g1_i1.p1 TRINITY_DN4226_c0_g1~~TRINITY_DN4226_c0_g1_i1.p1  ORF type:complete len:646 (-),score=158.09 TRINITY_DN4226_c0_g1_i1:134-2071(-)
MKRNISLWICFLLCIILWNDVSAQSTSEKLYRKIQGYPCTRLANLTHLIGCSSSDGGQFGSLLFISNSIQLNDFTSNPGKEPRVILLDPSLVSPATMEKLAETKRIGGVFVPPLNSFSDPLLSYSAEEGYPNKRFGLYPNSDFVWNPVGNGVNYNQINFPIYYLSQKEYDTFQVSKLAQDNGDSYPMNGARLSSFMHLSGPSDICLRRGQCDPLGGRSVWSALGGKVDPSQKIVLVVAHSDATALFHDKAIGADAAVSGKTALLLTAQALVEAQKTKKFNKQVVFALFDGESWGYLGSKRFVRDIVSFKCNEKLGHNSCKHPYAISTSFQNISFSSIESIIEIGQVGNVPSGSKQKLYLHADPKSGSNDLMTTIGKAATSVNIAVSDATKQAKYPGLPPSSLMAFLQQKPNLPSVLIAEHESQYINQYFGSHLDDASNIVVSSVITAARLASASVLALVGVDGVAPNISQPLANELVKCFTRNFTCDLSQTYLAGIPLNSDPTAYVGVWNYASVSVQSKLAHDVLYDITKVSETSKTCTSPEDCDSVWGDCVRGKCLVGATFYHDALTIGLEFDVDSYSYTKTDKWETESTWVESRWATTTVDLFVMDSPSAEVVTLIFGVIVTILSLIFVYVLKANLFKLFKSI